jgi:hypothetical protein
VEVSLICSGRVNRFCYSRRFTLCAIPVIVNWYIDWLCLNVNSTDMLFCNGPPMSNSCLLMLNMSYYHFCVFLQFVCLVRLAQLVDIPWRCSLKTQDILTPQLHWRDIIYTQSRNFTYHLVVSTLNHNVDYYTPLIIKRFLIITLLSSNFPDTNYSNYLSLCYFQLCYFFNNTGEAIIIHMLYPTFLVFSYNCCLFLF